jgi:hypothetical protein
MLAIDDMGNRYSRLPATLLIFALINILFVRKTCSQGALTLPRTIILTTKESSGTERSWRVIFLNNVV